MILLVFNLLKIRERILVSAEDYPSWYKTIYFISYRPWRRQPMIEGVERYPLELVAPGHHGNVVFGFVFVSAAVSLWLAQQLTVMKLVQFHCK